MSAELEAVLRRTIERERRARATAENLVEERTEALRLAYMSLHATEQQRFMEAMALMPCAIAIIENDGRISLANLAAANLLGMHASSELVGRNWSEWSVEHEDAQQTAEVGVAGESIMRLTQSNGRVVTVGLLVGDTMYQDRANRIFVMRDLSEQRRHEDALRHQATHDGLTGLPNRILLLDRVQQTIERAKRDGIWIAVFFIDLDKFKLINDSLGHSAGDQVLVEMAQRLVKLARSSDTVARLGGDEFVVTAEVPDQAQLDKMSQRIIAALTAPIELCGAMYTLGGSVGVAVFPEHGDDTEALLKRADLAMYQAKSQGGSVACNFSASMQEQIDRMALMETRLRNGIGKQELLLFFQPQVDFHSGTLVSVEALVRWNSPEYGLLAPGDFLRLAEETSLIKDLDTFVLNAACQQIAQWKAQGWGWIRVAVNLAATRFMDPNFPDELRRCIAKHAIPPGMLELEVSESLAMDDPSAALELMGQLKSMGVLLAIDDFGTGYSNLGYLKRFPADRLKVDQSFVRGLLNNPQDRAIVATVIQLAHHMNMRAIAEGVESEEEAIQLFALDVDEVQGFWLAHPQPATEIEKLFAQKTLMAPRKFIQQDDVPIVLLVEDEEITREIMTALLESFNVKVISAGSTEQAMALFHVSNIALAIVDHGLPGENGIVLLSRIKQQMPQAVRILVTASDDPQVLRDAINVGGASHFLSKPIDPDALKQIVMRVCWKNLVQLQSQQALPHPQS